ncbi:E3 ubiquitin-protein ligase RKP [Brassica rapa]|uniref:E3 ubiquitin-protein ligase RKP n=1 Tax=Brassica campestris TaxID=3711 RepID=UPI00142D4BB9|nr:E3 ubiquitin-protein ligase RKP [Brassica rapa]
MQEKYQVMEFQQRKCCVILELSSNLPRVLEVCTSAIPQAFLDGTDTNPSRLAEEGTNVPEVALPEVVVPGRDDKDGLMLPVPDVLQRPNTKEQLAIAFIIFSIFV